MQLTLSIAIMQVPTSVAIMQVLKLCCNYVGGTFFCCTYVGKYFCCIYEMFLLTSMTVSVAIMQLEISATLMEVKFLQQICG